MKKASKSRKSPPTAPRIQVTGSTVASPNAGSMEYLINEPPPSPPYRGRDNPVFSFDSAALFSRAPSKVAEISPAFEISFQTLPPTRRGSYFPFLPPESKHSLTVPSVAGHLSTGQRRSSLTSPAIRGLTVSSPAVTAHRPRPLISLSIDDLPGGPPADDYGAGLPIKSPGLFSTASMWSTSDLHHGTRVLEADTLSHVGSKSVSNVSGSFSDRMRELLRAFSRRTQTNKEKISQPATPSSESDFDAKSALSGGEEPQAPRNIRLGSFIPTGSRVSDAFSDDNHDHLIGVWHCKFKLPKFLRRFSFPSTYEPHTKFYVVWLFVVSLAFVYNAIAIPLRGVFPYQTEENIGYWLIADYFCDVIYIVDIIIFKPRVRFIDNGIIQCDRKETRKNYLNQWIFKFDLLSLTPLDLLYLIDSIRFSPWLRVPRVLKIQTYWEFFERIDQASRSAAHMIRILKTMTYMLLLIHLKACGYYAVSVYEGIGSTTWVYDGEGIAYLRCFFLAFKTATSIGNIEGPSNLMEYIFMTFYWLSGVFLFAVLIGQIRDIVEAAGMVRENYRKKMDSCQWYMQSIGLPKDMKDRVRDWFLYNWDQQKTIDERSLVSSLPRKMQTDLAINVHFNTLSKVQLFQDCERTFLYDLVLKLRPILYLPGDYICQKGEVGREMYIVSQGQVEVVGGENNQTVLATLQEGSVFGEISLLAMSGRGNRRTADVRSKGYTNVFTLSKFDFETAMSEYPDAHALLKRRAKKLLKSTDKTGKKQKKDESEEIIKPPPETPKMVHTVLQVLNPDSDLLKRLTPSSKRSPRSLERPHSSCHKLSPLPTADVQQLTTESPHSQSANPVEAPVDQVTPEPNNYFIADNDENDDVFDESSDDVSLPEMLCDDESSSSSSIFGGVDEEEPIIVEEFEETMKEDNRPDIYDWQPREGELKNGINKAEDESVSRQSRSCGKDNAGSQNENKGLCEETWDGWQKENNVSTAGTYKGRYEEIQDAERNSNESDAEKMNRRHTSNVAHHEQNNGSTAEDPEKSGYRSDSGGDIRNVYIDQRMSHSDMKDTLAVQGGTESSKMFSVPQTRIQNLAPSVLTLSPPKMPEGKDSGQRQRKVSVVSLPVSVVSLQSNATHSRGTGSPLVTFLRENDSEINMRCITPVEVAPTRSLPLPEPVRVNSPKNSSRSPASRSLPDIGKYERISSEDIPAQNRITCAVEIHRAKSVSSGTSDYRDQSESTV